MLYRRSARFKRSSHIISVRLTDRDVQIVTHIFRHRFLRSTHIVKLVGGSHQQVLRRLHRLFHNGYLDRPRSQIEHYRNGSQAMVYGIGHRGVTLLDQSLAISQRKSDWSAKNRNATRFFLEHTLAVAEVMVAMEMACREHGEIKLVPCPDKLVKWSVEVRRGGNVHTIGIIPDRVFGLRHNGTSKTVWYFLEADRATMPVERHNLKQTSFARKLVAYYETWKQGVLRESYPRFRVLTVTTTPERAQNLIDAHQRANRGSGSGVFLFTHNGEFTGKTSPLDLLWLNGRGEHAHVIE